MWSIQIMEYYSALNRKLTHITTWRNPEDILSELNQLQKENIVVPTISGTQSGQIHRDKAGCGWEGTQGFSV